MGSQAGRGLSCREKVGGRCMVAEDRGTNISREGAQRAFGEARGQAARFQRQAALPVPACDGLHPNPTPMLGKARKTRHSGNLRRARCPGPEPPAERGSRAGVERGDTSSRLFRAADLEQALSLLPASRTLCVTDEETKIPSQAEILCSSSTRATLSAW